MNKLKLIYYIAGLFCLLFLSGCSSINLPANGHLPSSIRIVVKEDIENGAIVEDVVTLLKEDQTHWRPENLSTLNMVNLKGVEFEQRRNMTLRTKMSFVYKGETNEARRVVVDYKVKDDNGDLIFHSWRITEDARFLPDSFPYGSGIFHVVKVNSARFEMPAKKVPQMKDVVISFRNIQPSDIRHFPDEPPKYGLTVTEPDNGKVRISFENPDWKHLKEGVNAYVVVVNVKNSEGKMIERIVENFEYKNLKQGERNEFTFPIDKQYYDYSSCSVTFYTKQPDNDGFIQKFFVEGKGSRYESGIWTGTGGELRRLPLDNYSFWINTSKFRNFSDKNGVPVEPVEVRFKTGQK